MSSNCHLTSTELNTLSFWGILALYSRSRDPRGRAVGPVRGLRRYPSHTDYPGSRWSLAIIREQSNEHRSLYRALSHRLHSVLVIILFFMSWSSRVGSAPCSTRKQAKSGSLFFSAYRSGDNLLSVCSRRPCDQIDWLVPLGFAPCWRRTRKTSLCGI